MGRIDEQQQEEENSAEEEEGAYPALIEITRRLEADLGVSGTMTEVIDAACKDLGLSTDGINIIERAHRAHDQLTARRRKPPPTTSR